MIRAAMRAILFDFNGVLVDDEPIHLELMRQVLAEEGVEFTDQQYFSRYLGLDDRTCLAAILQDHGNQDHPKEAPAHLLPRLVARKSTYYHARIREQGFPIFPGARELIEATAAADWQLGVVSGALRDEVEGGLEQMGVRHLFKTIVAAEDVRRGKPDPEGYRRGLQDLNSLPPLPTRLLHPHEVLAVEDSPPGLEAASALGLTTIGLAHTYAADRLQRADRVIDSIAGLTVPLIRQLFPNDG